MSLKHLLPLPPCTMVYSLRASLILVAKVAVGGHLRESIGPLYIHVVHVQLQYRLLPYLLNPLLPRLVAWNRSWREKAKDLRSARSFSALCWAFTTTRSVTITLHLLPIALALALVLRLYKPLWQSVGWIRSICSKSLTYRTL